MVTRGKIDDYKCPKLEKLNNTVPFFKIQKLRRNLNCQWSVDLSL